MSSAEHLVRLGLNKNEARALDALIALGPSGASDVHRHSGMPRNKAYEALERLADRGMVEVQHGRPTLYRATGPKEIISSLVEGYGAEAREALRALSERREDLEEGAEGPAAAASAWMVRGDKGVRRRLAELLYGAESDVFCIFGYPPKHLLSAKTALKAAARRGVSTRAVCMIRPTDEPEVSPDDSQVVEFRTVKASRAAAKMDPYDERLIGSFANMQGNGGMVIVDESVAFDIVDDGRDPQSVAGIVFRAPGIPRIQKATVERILSLYTRRL